MAKGSAKAKYLAKVNATRDALADDLTFLGIAIRLYRGLASAGRTITMKLGVLKAKIVSIMLAHGLVKFVSKRTEAKLIYEIKLPDNDKGEVLATELLRLMQKHGVLDKVPSEKLQYLFKREKVVTLKIKPTDRCKKLLRSNPELWEEVKTLLKQAPKLDVGPVTKKTMSGH